MVTRRLGVLVAALALVAAACGGSGGGGAGTLPPSVSRPDQSATSTPSGGGSEPSRTSVPRTDPPATDAPATEAPARTDAPVTEAPARTDAPVSDAPATTAAEPADEGGGTPWWPWILALAVVVAIVGATLVVRRRRTAARWRERANAAVEDAEQIAMRLLAVPPAGLSTVAGPEAARLAALLATVGDLAASSPEDGPSRAMAGLQVPVGVLQQALDAIAIGQLAPSVEVAGEVRNRATQLHSASSVARAALAAPG
jgi:hypothetical protein